MFCNACGNTTEPGQTFCSHCGKQLIYAFGQPQPGRVQEHVRLLGILWLALGAVNVVGGVILEVLANTLFVHLVEQGAPMFLRPLLSVVGMFILLKAAAAFIAGWGLLQHQPWARILALVVAFVSLFNVPFGTALGVYTLWVLLPGRSEEEYESLVRTAPVHA